MSDKKILCIIPARGGSKGIRRKNIKELGGKPLIIYSIEAALNASVFPRVVVTTDDFEIAEISRKAGAEVVTRPDEISGDDASSETALLHVLESLKVEEQYVPDIIVFLQCTNPFTISKDIDDAVNLLCQKKVETVFSVTPSHVYLWKEVNSCIFSINHEIKKRGCRQSFEKQYLETGSLYVMETQSFLNRKSRFSDKMSFIVIPKERAVEIDDMFDWRVAESVIQHFVAVDKESALPKKINAVVFDFDGVFTDNTVTVDENGVEQVICNRGDGWGIARLLELKIPVFVLSTEKNKVVKARCDKLKIDCIHGVDDKLSSLRTWCIDNKVSLNNVVFVGNDVNDLECLQASGCGVVVRDAHPFVEKIADIVLDFDGGDGAVRQICDMILDHEVKMKGSSRDV